MSNADKNWKNKVYDLRDEFDFDLIREGKELDVAEVVPGMEIITSWSRSGKVKTTTKVQTRVPCPGGNGLQVHINRSDCYDSRSKVWVR